MGLTVWVLKSSGSGWRGGSEGRKSPQEIAAFGDGFDGKNWRKSSDAFLVIPDYLQTTAVFLKDLMFCKLFQIKDLFDYFVCMI